MIPSVRFAALLALVSLGSVASAQLSYSSLPSARVGLVAGMNRATFDSDEPGLVNRNAFVGGISTINTFTPTLAWEVDVLYSMKGAKTEDASSNSSATLKFNYITIP